MPLNPQVATCLWMEKNGQEAAEFYVSLLPDSQVTSAAPPMIAFTLSGVPYLILEGGPHFQLTPAVSISVSTEGQAETDRLWDALLADAARKACAAGWWIGSVCRGRSCRWN